MHKINMKTKSQTISWINSHPHWHIRDTQWKIQLNTQIHRKHTHKHTHTQTHTHKQTHTKL